MACVQDVAKYFLSLSEVSTPFAITPLKLQKLVYYAQGIHLRDNPEPLFEENLLAWDHGPVNRLLYDQYKQRGYLTINPEPFPNANEELTDDEIRSIDEAWEQYGQLDGKILEELTHQEDPWLFTPRNHVIPIDVIREYFIENQPLMLNI